MMFSLISTHRNNVLSRIGKERPDSPES